MSGNRWTTVCMVVLVMVLCVPPVWAAAGPGEMVQAVTDQLLAEIHRDPDQLADIASVRALAERYILPHIDFHAASQWVLGKHWRNATAAQRTAFEREFRAMLLNTYLRAVSNYQDYTFRIRPARVDVAAGRAEVDAGVERADGPPVQLGFRLHRVRGEWLIFDITVEGISLVTTHRSAFAREIGEQGLDSLITRLAGLNAYAAASPAN